MVQERSQIQPMIEESVEKSDLVSRRRLQNRLNQRASRKRKQAKKQREQRKQRWIIYINEVRASPVPEHAHAKRTPELPLTRKSSPISQGHKGHFFCGSSQLSLQQCFNQLRRQMVEAADNLPPSPSLIHSVKQFNIIRAMFENAAHMELTMDILCEDIASLFNIAGPITFNLPPSLQPSSTQRQIIHHPWIDLLPVRSFRDTLIARMSEYDDEEICVDLYGLGSTSGEVGLIIWGESWDPSAYELSEQVVEKWGWILNDSPELLASTNYWRRKRGERPLKFAESLEHFIHEIN